MALFAVLGTSSAMAQDVDIIWEEDFSSYSKDDVPSGGDYSYVCTGGGTKIYAEELAGGAAPELLISKKSSGSATDGGTFTATINLGSKSGDMFLAFKCNKNFSSSVTVTGGTLGAVQKSNNDYVFPITNASGTLTIKFENTLTSNARLDNIKLYQGNAKKPAGIAWNKATASVTYGNPDDTYKYLPTFSNPNELNVTFKSSNSDVISISTDGEIEVEGVGEATLTASFAGNDEYEAAEVTCKVTVKEAEPEKTDISNTEATAYTIAKAKELIDDANSDLTKEVYVKGIISKIEKFNSDNSITYWISDDGTTNNQFECYKGKNIDGADFAAATDLKVGATVIVKGKLKKFNTTYEFDAGNVLVSYDESTAGGDPEEIDATIAGLYSYTAATSNIKLTINNGKVVYVDGKSIYVREGEKAMLFYDCGLTLPLNAVVSGTVSVDLDIYKGLHEVKANSKTNADNLTITESSDEAAPVEATFDKLASKDYTNDLIIIKNQSVIEDDGKWYIQNGDAKIQLFKKNADYSSYVSDTKKYDIIAIATVYNSNAQLTPISFSETTGIQNLTIDADANAPMYNLKGERVDANYRGVVIKAGKKTIQK
jgi:hypothetical protein